MESFAISYYKKLKPIRLLSVVYYKKTAKSFSLTRLVLAVFSAPNSPKSFLPCKPQGLSRCHLPRRASESTPQNGDSSRCAPPALLLLCLGLALARLDQSSPHSDHQAARPLKFVQACTIACDTYAVYI